MAGNRLKIKKVKSKAQIPKSIRKFKRKISDRDTIFPKQSFGLLFRAWRLVSKVRVSIVLLFPLPVSLIAQSPAGIFDYLIKF